MRLWILYAYYGYHKFSLRQEDHYTKDCPRWFEVSHLLKGTLVVLKEPFPSQQTQMVDQPQSSTSIGSQLFMINTPINVATTSKYYQTPTPTVRKEKEVTPSSSILSSSGPLHIEWPNLDSAIQPPSRGVLRKSLYNPNTRATQHYNIVEDSAQAPSTMSSLEVLQSYPSQRKSLLLDIGGIDLADSNLICFDLENHILHIPH